MQKSYVIIIGVILLVCVVIWWWSRQACPTTKCPDADCPVCAAPVVNRWDEIYGVGHDGDNIGKELGGLTLADARNKCISDDKCKSVFFWGEDSKTKQGKAWLKTADKGPYTVSPEGSTHLLRR